MEEVVAAVAVAVAVGVVQAMEMEDQAVEEMVDQNNGHGAQAVGLEVVMEEMVAGTVTLKPGPLAMEDLVVGVVEVPVAEVVVEVRIVEQWLLSRPLEVVVVEVVVVKQRILLRPLEVVEAKEREDLAMEEMVAGVKHGALPLVDLVVGVLEVAVVVVAIVVKQWKLPQPLQAVMVVVVKQSRLLKHQEVVGVEEREDLVMEEMVVVAGLRHGALRMEDLVVAVVEVVVVAKRPQLHQPLKLAGAMGWEDLAEVCVEVAKEENKQLQR